MPHTWCRFGGDSSLGTVFPPTQILESLFGISSSVHGCFLFATRLNAQGPCCDLVPVPRFNLFSLSHPLTYLSPSLSLFICVSLREPPPCIGGTLTQLSRLPGRLLNLQLAGTPAGRAGIVGQRKHGRDMKACQATPHHLSVLTATHRSITRPGNRHIWLSPFCAVLSYFQEEKR